MVHIGNDIQYFQKSCIFQAGINNTLLIPLTQICYKNSTVSASPNENFLENINKQIHFVGTQNLQLIPFMLYRINMFLNIQKRKLLFNSYILTHLDYCCIIWGNYSDSSEYKLIKFQKESLG